MRSTPPRPTVILLAATIALATSGDLPAQQAPSTDIYVAPLAVRDGRVEVGTPVNVTRHRGYDNQPAFTSDGRTLLYTVVRDSGSQADINRLDLATLRSAPITRTPESEYSPTLTPDGHGISVVRVERDSTQRLWRVPLEGGDATLLIPRLAPVGYQAWLDDHTLALFVLGSPNALVIADTRTGSADTVARNVGRSLHALPGARVLGYVAKRAPHEWWLTSMDPATRKPTDLVRLPDGVEDYAWLPDGSAIVGQGSVLLRWRPGTSAWERIADLSGSGVDGITRLAVSPAGDRIAIVARERDEARR